MYAANIHKRKVWSNLLWSSGMNNSVLLSSAWFIVCFFQNNWALGDLCSQIVSEYLVLLLKQILCIEYARLKIRYYVRSVLTIYLVLPTSFFCVARKEKKCLEKICPSTFLHKLSKLSLLLIIYISYSLSEVKLK